VLLFVVVVVVVAVEEVDVGVIVGGQGVRIPVLVVYIVL
jgi:hypothetical protein